MPTYITNKRSPITPTMREYFRIMSNDNEKICPYCGNPLFGDFHIAHVRAVKNYGDAMEDTMLVAMHPSCNGKIGTNTLDMKGIDKKHLVYCHISTKK